MSGESMERMHAAGQQRKPRVLFLCTGNSCRSQMAEGWGRHLLGDQLRFCSAGIETHGLNPRAVQVMREAGVDISGHDSKTLNELDVHDLDWVISVCGHAEETCPSLPERVRRLHIGFDDPPRLARDAENEEEALGHYRRVRDEIRAVIERLQERMSVPEECAAS